MRFIFILSYNTITKENKQYKNRCEKFSSEVLVNIFITICIQNIYITGVNEKAFNNFNNLILEVD